jgi:hypothetical protein
MPRACPTITLLAMLSFVTTVGGCAAEGARFADPAATVGTRVRYAAGPPAAEAVFAARPRYDARAEDAPAAAATAAPALPAPPPADAADAAARPAGAVDPATPRQVIYSAAFKVVVADVAGTLAAIRDQAEKLGGYLAEVNGAAITVRVPVGRFADAVAFVERVGDVVDRQLRAQDVTEELRDLDITLDNNEKLRQRLQALLDKAERVEDVLKIEAELTRVTGEIEQTKGRLRYLNAQVAMSTVRVELNSPVPQQYPGGGGGQSLPFDWVGELGAGLVEGQVRQTVKRAGVFGRGPKFRPPAGFVRYYEDDGEAEAMDAGDLRLRVVRRRNVDKAGLAFWSRLARKTLVENRSLAVTAEEGGADGDGFYLLRGTRDVGGKPVGYLLSIERGDRAVVVFEAWGPLESFDANLDAIRASALSADPG